MNGAKAAAHGTCRTLLKPTPRPANPTCSLSGERRLAPQAHRLRPDTGEPVKQTAAKASAEAGEGRAQTRGGKSTDQGERRVMGTGQAGIFDVFSVASNSGGFLPMISVSALNQSSRS